MPESGRVIAENNRKLFNSANNSQRRRWQRGEQQSYEYSIGEQQSKDEIDQLEASGMPTFTVDMISPVIGLMKYFVTANNPRWNGIGADGSDIDIAHVFSTMSDYFWYISDGGLQYSQIIDNSFRKSKGYFHLYVDPNADRGMGEVMFRSENPFRVWVDPMSHDPLERDALFKIIKGDFPRHQLIDMLPQFKSKILKAKGVTDRNVSSERDLERSISYQEQDSTEGLLAKDGREDDIIPYFQVYRKIRVPYYKVFIKILPSEKDLKAIRAEIEIQIEELTRELQVQVQEKAAELKEGVEKGEVIQARAELEITKAQEMAKQTLAEQQQILYSKAVDSKSKVEEKIVPEKQYEILIKNKEVAKTIVYAKRYYEIRIERTASVGDDTLLFKQIMNQSEYPLIPLYFEHTGTVYGLGAVTPLKGKQDEITKAHQIMIHNANLGSNLRWLVQQGQVKKDYWEQYSSSAGAILEWQQTGVNDNPPVAIQPAPLNNAFYSIVEKGKEELEYKSMVNSSMMGDTSKQPEPYRGMLANDEFGTRRIKQWMNNVLNPVLEHVGKVYMEMSQDFYEVQKVFRIVQPNAAGEMQTREVEINVPLYNDYTNEIIGRYKNYNSLRFDVRVVAGSTLPVNRWALLDEYYKWFEAGILDDIHFVNETDIQNKEQLLQRKAFYVQLQQKIAQLEEMVKNSKGTIETLERQIIQANIKVKVGDANTEIRKALLEQKNEVELAVDKAALALDAKVKSVGNKDTSKKSA